MCVYYFGVTRFSVFSPGSLAWVLSKDKKEKKQYIENLYSEERMTVRSDIFFRKALPSYELMGKSYLYKHIVQYSEELPDKWKDKLFEAAAKYSFVILQNVSKIESAHDVIRDYLKNLDACDSVVTMFRVDDDDVLSFDYLYQLSRYSVEDNIGKAVSFGSGLAAIYSNGKFENFRKFRKLLMSQGQAYIGNYDSKRGKVFFPRTGNHARIDELTPVILDSRSIAFLQTSHDLQDTRISESKEAAKERILKSFLNYESIENYVLASEKFPLFKNEILMQETGVADFIKFEDGVLNEMLSFDVSLLDSRQYHVEYIIEGGSEELNDRGVLIGFLAECHKNEIPGLVKSSNEDLGFYKYLPTGPGSNKGVFSFWVPEGVKVYNVFLKPWKCAKGEAKLNKLSLSM